MSTTPGRLAAPVLLLLGLAAPAAAQTGAAAPKADTACAACSDFYGFANREWLASTQIPAAYSGWSAFHEVYENNQNVLKQVLDDAAERARTAPAGSDAARLGTFYGTCMDSARAEAEGARPLGPWLRRIDAVSTPAQLNAELARLKHDGVDALFSFYASQDDKNSAQVVAIASQGGLGLPDRDYYLKTDSASRALREAYRGHVERTFRLLGLSEAQARADAARVLALETALAEASMTQVQQRDPNAIYHKMSFTQVQALAPALDWSAQFREMGMPNPDSMVVRQPEFFRAVGRLMRERPLADWKAYLRWNVADEAAPMLSSAFVAEDFRWNQTLTGVRELLPRWKRCLTSTDEGIGEELGRAYVERVFTPQARARVLEMVNNLRDALRERLGTLEWMSDSTRAEALLKLDAFTRKIGYPDAWRDYSALEVRPESFVLNAARASRFERDRNFRKIGRPVDRTEWLMTPPTVNAYYEPTINEIVFPAGILQPPFFDPAADDATNYGGMGAVIGHEMTHGFDDQGRQYDARGNLRDWWTEGDATRYKAQAQRVIDQFGGYVALDTLRVNGELTAGENIADLGGLTIAYAAFRKAQAGKPRETVGGFTPEQRFFLSWARIWRNQYRPEQQRVRLATDPHAPGRFRVNGPLSNMPEFAAAFGCKVGDPMVRGEQVRATIW